ncbi:MAG: RICIN domain-containing protein, partial [Limisphaerales bacterium]
YNSGTFYLKQQITINRQYPVWDISGQFKVPAQKGCWPAFWMTGANSWPPESDFMEFKGSTGCNQNTYNGSWQGKITTVSTASTAWHTYRVVACLENSTNVDFHYYIDGVMESEQTTTTFVGSPCWLIIDYQMEGSSGSPGPSYTTYAYVTNIVVKRLNANGVGSGPVANGAYQIVARGSGDVLDVGNQNTANNSSVDQWPYNAGLNQQWIVTHLGNDQYSIIGRQSGRALQVTNAATTNGAGANIMDYANGANQKWTLAATLDGYYNMINVNSGKMMEVSNNSTNNFAPIDQWSSGNTTFPLINIAFPSGTNLVLSGSTGIPGITYLALSSTDLTATISDWTSVATVVFDQSGDFSSTNGIAP